MINRILIRIKVVQMLYSYMVSGNSLSVRDAKKELSKSLELGYELYHYLLLLIVELTELHADRLEQAKNKFLPTEEELNPNTKLIDNLFVKALMEDADFRSYIDEKPITWRDDDIFMKLMLDRVLRSEEYAQYIDSEGNDFDEDCVFWHSVMKNVILPDEELSDILESKSVYWNDDLETMGTFTVKTIKRFEDKVEDPILPMYKDNEDSEFGKTLFTKAVEMRAANDEIINAMISGKWDAERIAFMDRVIMGVAITEVKEFISIPTSVTLNEYIEIAKYYSTPKSGSFVNGILNNVIKDFKSRRIIVKD